MQRVYKAPYEGSFAPKPAILGRNRKWQGCPIGCRQLSTRVGRLGLLDQRPVSTEAAARADPRRQSATCQKRPAAGCVRSEEHTSELQSLMRISYAVFCLKKKNNTIT